MSGSSSRGSAKQYIEEQDFAFEYAVGIDEVGLGAIAGPIIAVACMFSKDKLPYLRQLDYKPKKKSYYITDSKVLPPEVREHFHEKILQLCDSIGYGVVTVEEINEIQNIATCGSIARSRALIDLLRWAVTVPEIVLIDGPQSFEDQLPIRSIKTKAVVKGDSKYVIISAASIVAKVTRDNIMKESHHMYPYYCWDQNAGYPTSSHIESIKKYGTTPEHRIYLVNRYLETSQKRNQSSQKSRNSLKNE